eukprot:TRINITY_DN31550_c0_g1_i2.p1 TRINITY_DN31550_c0_g1~~TRINITY_DN31550_c0_g1_i2.p1  ORF type:complete len:143 (+),score=56.17 TRINITY_DN31550_c0_g1_i2:2-430(+)
MRQRQEATALNMPFSALHGIANATTREHLHQATSMTTGLLNTTNRTLQREQHQLAAVQLQLEKIDASKQELLARVSFNESQLEICVESLKDSGLEHLRGSTALDQRGLAQKLSVEGSVTAALDQIVEAVAELRQVNRRYGSK